MTPHTFVEKWRDHELKERSAYQEHFIDLCHLIGHPTPVESDPTGKRFTFEAFADKTDGGKGFADVWKRDAFAWEYKGKHANLDKAYQQLLQYREALFNPPLLVVSDTNRIVVHTNFTNTAKQKIEIILDDLLTPRGRELLDAVFNNPFQFKSKQTTAQVTEQAAKEFGLLAEHLRNYGIQSHDAAHFLIRILFSLFAEDVGLLPNHLFSKLTHTKWSTTSDLTEQLKDLFRKMAKGGYFGTDKILRFNGGLFDDDTAYELGSDGLKILRRVSELDWSSIEPSIFGTLFERSLDPEKRSQIGAHYTSREDIELIIEPVLMLPLRRRWTQEQEKARALAAQRDALAGNSKTVVTRRAQINKQLQTQLMAFTGEIARVQVLDPACGSGNFLYVALKALLDLENSVITFMRELRIQPAYPTVHPSQLHGIEINAYAYELAQATVWIGYIQWLHENGYGFPPEPILQPLHNFSNMDAILARDAQEKPVEPEWQPADVIIGNPPFLGDKKMRAELGDNYVDGLRTLFEDRIPGQSDLVCYWFEKARAMIAEKKVERAGLLATNSIRGGANRRVLERIKETGDIFFAVSDRDWILDGAAVNVSLIGFDKGFEKEKSLDGDTVRAINANLTAEFDLTKAKRLGENRGICLLGTFKVGAFDISNTLAAQFLSMPLNPNRRPNSDVVRPFMNGWDATHRSRDMWIIDFRNMSLDEASLYEAPFQHIKKVVKPQRDVNRRERRKKYWWKHGETSPSLYAVLDSRERFIATSSVAKHRVFVWIERKIVPDHTLVVFAREDDYFLGVLQSKPHQLWSFRLGTSLEDRPRYTPTTTFETFPFPFPPGQEMQSDPRVTAISTASRELVQLRDNWLNPPDISDADLKKRTLTNLYNQNPQWLENAHRKLDEAVFAAYGWRTDLTDDEILANLLALNLERAKSAVS